jgi:nitrite reductase (NO-forming)
MYRKTLSALIFAAVLLYCFPALGHEDKYGQPGPDKQQMETHGHLADSGQEDTDTQDKGKKQQIIKHGHLPTFGPADSPHYHVLDLNSFDRVADIARLPTDLPPPIERNVLATVKVTLHAKEVIAEIAPDITYHYWTYNKKIPGPFIRVRQNDTVELTIINDITSSHSHSIDLHAVNGPGGGAQLTQGKPGETKAFRFKALNPGLYVYHCATPNVPMHITNGLFGLILVEPPGGLSQVAREFYIVQSEIYTKGKIGMPGFQEFDADKMLHENPEYILFNGRVKALVDHPLTAYVGETVRLYVGNAGVSKISSFHVIGEIFDRVYPEASTPVKENVQTTIIPAGGATIVEFTLNVPGTYVLVDHALTRIEKGAWGLLNVEGEAAPAIYSNIEN